MEIKFKMSMNVPEELAKELNLNEDTAFQTYYEDGKIYIETIDAEGFLTEEDEELDDYDEYDEEDDDCDGNCDYCDYCCPCCGACILDEEV